MHPGVGAVSFTGSVPTGRKVAAAAMENGPRLVSLELGGKNAMIVWRDADLDLVTEGALFGAFGTAGQRCTSTSRLIVHPDVADEVVDRVAGGANGLRLGDPTDPSTDVGPVITAESARRIKSMVDDAVAEGAELVCGGRIRTDVDGCEGGTFFEPTILAGVKPEHRIAQQEVFGPVLAVIEVGAMDEAVDVVNSVEYGLSAAVYSRDINTALRAVGRHRHRDRVRQRADHRRRDSAAVRRHQAHRQRVPGGRHPGHRAVQPDQDRLRRLLGPAAEGPDRHPPARRLRGAR